MRRNAEPVQLPTIIVEDKEDKKFNDEYYYKILNKNRTILLFDEIDPCSSDIVITKIIGMNLLDTKKPITMYINSGGGSVSDGFAIINAMEQSVAPIHTIINGQACSMAAMISVVGHKRSIFYNSYWMNHPLSEGGNGDYLQFIKDRTKFLIHLDKMTENLLRKYTKLTNLDIKKIENGELWLSAEESMRKGIVDCVIQPRKK